MADRPWERVRLGELAKVKHGWPFKSTHFREPDGDLPIVLAIGNFEYTGGFRFSRSVSKAYAAKYPPEYEANPGDIMLVMTCQTAGGEILGVPALVPNDGRLYLHNQRIGKLEIRDSARLNPAFAYHWARGPVFNRQLFETASGSKILHTSPNRIEATRIDLPPLHEQRAIAEVLGALDDKIAANDRLIAVAEDLATATYRRSLTSAVAVPLSSLARFVNGRAFTKDASGTGRVVIRIAELNSGIGGSTIYNDIEVDKDNLASPGDLLFAWSGSLTVHRWFRPDAIVNQHIFKVIPEPDRPMWLVNQALRLKLREFQAIAADKATTMGHIQRRHLDEPAAIPDDRAISSMNPLMGGLWDRALSAEQESLRLAKTRDELLPLLMSGKVRVRVAEKIVEEAV